MHTDKVSVKVWDTNQESNPKTCGKTAVGPFYEFIGKIVLDSIISEVNLKKYPPTALKQLRSSKIW